MIPRDLRGTVAIVGADEADEIGLVPGKSVLTLQAEAVRNAVTDAGLKISDIDGIFTAGGGFAPSSVLGEYLGISPRYTDGTSVGGCSFILMVEHAMLALHASIIDVAVVAHAESGRSRIGAGGGGFNADGTVGQFESPFGVVGAPTTFSLPATRHMHEFGTTREQMAWVSVSTRKWAQMHPKAMMKDDLDLDGVLNSRMVVWPYNLLMCCLVTDAAGAIVLTRSDRARDLKQKPVYVLGTGEGTEHAMISQIADLTTSKAARTSGKAAFEMAGVSHKEIDVAELYDAFSFTPMIALEDLGFVGRGESGPFVENGRTGPGGDFPMNTNGGGLSYTHSGMYGMFTLIELTRQLRGTEGQRQVKDAKIGLAHGPGGMLSAAATLIAGNEIP